MTQLCTGVVEARNDLTADDDTTTDTGAQGDHNRILSALGGAGHHLAPCGGVGVVLNEYILHGEACLHRVTDGELIEGGDVAAVLDHSRIVVGDTGGCDTHRSNIGGVNAGLAADGMADGGHVGGDLLGRTVSPRGDACLTDDFKIFIHNTGGDVGATQVNTDTIHTRNSPLL